MANNYLINDFHNYVKEEKERRKQCMKLRYAINNAVKKL
jgi:hypothetical protein